MNAVVTFVKDSWAELKQSSWLSVPEMIASTWIVVILVILTSAFLFVVDKILSVLIGALL